MGLSATSRFSTAADRPRNPNGHVVGEPTAEAVGEKILSEGGNAIDAIVAAALAVAVAAPNQTGIGGYGISAIVAVDSGKQVVAIDGNTMAPAATQSDIFRSVAEGKDQRRVNAVGWLAAGVPGILAGLQLLIDRFGTLSFSELVQPAIAIATHGFPWPANLAAVVRGDATFANDPGSRKLYFRDGQPLSAGQIYKNLDLASMLKTLANSNSVEAFYRGDIAQRIADDFQKNGGLVTAKDLAAYEAKVVEPLSMSWNDMTIQTPPLTAGGITVLQSLKTLQAMKWSEIASDIEQLHAKIEASRWAWNDRLTLLGDPSFANVPIERLLSNEYAERTADKIKEVVQKKSFIPFPIETKTQGGTISLSAVDRNGNMAVLTLTHGEAFGSRVTVDGLGLTLGHGMSRFDVRPDHPNAPGPGKRPLHNMVPTIVSRSGQANMAVGGRGGRKIINAVLETLTQYVGKQKTLSTAINSARFHTEGNSQIELEKSTAPEAREAMKQIGYNIKESASATLSAVAIENSQLHASMR